MTKADKNLAVRHGLAWRRPGTSHVTFAYPGLALLTVPAHKPIKPIYVTRFVALIELIGDADEGR